MYIRLATILFASLIFDACAEAQESLQYVPAAVDNPLKGLVPYSGEKRDHFPHSMEFNYLPLSQLMTGMTEFNWQPLERLLNDVAGRGHQTIFRVWMVYPGHDDGIPEFLVRDGLKVTTWLMDTGMMEKKQSDTRRRNASRAVQKMGYEFQVTQASVAHDSDRTRLKVELRNSGVAPFYYDWKIVTAALDKNGKPLKQWPTDWKITGLLPDSPSRSWESSVESSQIPSDAEWLAVQVVNPLPLGLPLRFANSADRQQSDGWFRIGRIRAGAAAESM